MNMDNQQVKSLFDLGWVSAIIDGEGWLIINSSDTRQNGIRYAPVIGMNNTSVELVDRLSKILTEWGIGHWRGERNFKNPNHQKQYMITISGYKRCIKLLPILKDILIVKKQQASILLELVEYRLSLTNKHSVCGEKEIEYKRLIQQLNSKIKKNPND